MENVCKGVEFCLNSTYFTFLPFVVLFISSYLFPAYVHAAILSATFLYNFGKLFPRVINYNATI